MREAIRLASAGVRAGRGGPFGAVVVQAGQIVGRGWNEVTSSNDPTAHAEMVAIRDASRQLGSFSLAGCEIYASCEPCPMCLAAIYWSRIERLYYAAGSAAAAASGFDDEHIRRQLQLPLASQSLPSQQLATEGALAPFADWERQADKIPY
jgi:tRNA(Arg) A34 adenosine deaminase TadA